MSIIIEVGMPMYIRSTTESIEGSSTEEWAKKNVRR